MNYKDCEEFMVRWWPDADAGHQEFKNCAEQFFGISCYLQHSRVKAERRRGEQFFTLWRVAAEIAYMKQFGRPLGLDGDFDT